MSYLVSDIGSITATQGSGNKIVTWDGRTHFVWQDHTAEGFFNRVRTFDHATESLSETHTLNQGRDDHARSILTIDQEGYLHAILSGHNSSTTYQHSQRPNDASAWTNDVSVGSGTYPVLQCGPDGTLYLTQRNSDEWNSADLYRKEPGGDWCEGPKPIARTDRYAGYAAYTNGMAMPLGGVLHVVWDFFETEGVWEQYGLEQAIGYMRSRDGANTWEGADGKSIETPARPESMDLFAQHTEPFDQINPGSRIGSSGAIAVDAAGSPVVLFISHVDDPGQLTCPSLAGGGRWQCCHLDVVEQAYPDMRPAALDRGMTHHVDGTIRVLLELIPLADGWDPEGTPTAVLGNPDRPGKLLVWLTSQDGARTWKVEPALEPGTFFNRANLERATGACTLEAGKSPAFSYHDGPTREEEGEVTQANVYFVPPKCTAQ